MGGEFFDYGRQHHISKIPANPSSVGVSTMQEYNEYMNGYNSVQEFSKDIISLVRSHNPRARGLVHILTESLILSLKEPADEKTELDKKISANLAELRLHDPHLENGIRELYNAIQKSKRFKEVLGEKIKQIYEKK